MSQVWHGIDWDEVDRNVRTYHELHELRRRIDPRFRPRVLIQNNRPFLLLTLPEEKAAPMELPGSVTELYLEEHGRFGSVTQDIFDLILGALVSVAGSLSAKAGR